MTNKEYIDKEAEIYQNRETKMWSHNDLHWRDPAAHNVIYSVHEFVQILNETLNTVFYRFLHKIDSDAKNNITENDPWWTTDVYPILEHKHIAFFKYESGRLCLYILAYMRRFLASDTSTGNLNGNKKNGIGVFLQSV